MAEGNRLPSLNNAPHLKTDGEFFVYQHYSVTTILQVVTPISILKNVIFCSSLQYRSSKITPSLFVDKVSCTRQFESELSLHSLASLFPIKEGIFSNPSVSLSKGSSTSNQAFLLRRKDVTALRCSEPLRSKVGGPSKVFAIFCGMEPPSYYRAKGAGYYPYFKTTLACNKSQRERNVFNVYGRIVKSSQINFLSLPKKNIPQ